ncbi:MAG TPA: alpha/beta fold hydrolase [Streptosporangiaceae bacterium]|nr:alpha/beta fold hydrolase [Streptosporangiaceae bacterium]
MRTTVTAAIVLSAALAVAAAGCAGPDRGPAASAGAPASPTAAAGTAGASPEAAATRQCGSPDAPGRLVTVRAADGVRIAAIEAGAGARGAVLIPELGVKGKCGWWGFAAYLAARGYRVLAFDHRCTGQSACPAGRAAGDLMSDIRGAAARLRQDGAARVALVGASQGGSEALIAATAPGPGVTGVAALSADELTTPLASAPYPATAQAAMPRVRLPALLAVAAADRYVSVPGTRSLLARAASASKRLIVLPADAGHGWDLVTSFSPGDPPPAFARTVLAFLDGVTA